LTWRCVASSPWSRGKHITVELLLRIAEALNIDVITLLKVAEEKLGRARGVVA
jgi:transcriptional regulator with XRE-family HTH domain